MSNALLIVDMQNFVEQRINQGMDFYPTDALANIKRLLSEFRRTGQPVIHVLHHVEQTQDAKPIPANTFVPLADFAAVDNEPVFTKNTSSAFASTDLKSHLDNAGITTLTVVGSVCGFCVNSTVRHGCDLGLNMQVVPEATISFPLGEGAGEAKNIHEVTFALLGADFARILTLDKVLATS